MVYGKNTLFFIASCLGLLILIVLACALGGQERGVKIYRFLLSYLFTYYLFFKFCFDV